MFGIETILIVLISVVAVILLKSFGLWWLWKKFRGPVIEEKIRQRQAAEMCGLSADPSSSQVPSPAPSPASELESSQIEDEPIPMLLSPELKARAKASRNPQDGE
jgi:hypothetical protein